MSTKLLSKIYKAYLRYLAKKLKKHESASNKFTLANKEIYHNKDKNHFYLKVITTTGFICHNMTVEELVSNKTVFDSLDINSKLYVYYVIGVLETLASSGQNSIYTFYGISPHNCNEIIVKSLVDMSLQKWNIIDAYNNGLYDKLDKASMLRFFEVYFIAKQNTEHNPKTYLKLVK